MSFEAASSPLRRGRVGKILRRGPLEAIATAIIAAGVVMLMQPFFLTLYSWSFATTLFGTVMFIIVSKVRE
jgi:energy-converting hydrogenase Eha subunit C